MRLNATNWMTYDVRIMTPDVRNMTDDVIKISNKL